MDVKGWNNVSEGICGADSRAFQYAGAECGANTPCEVWFIQDLVWCLRHCVSEWTLR